MIEIISNRSDETRLAVVAATRFGGPVARPAEFDVFLKQLRLKGVENLVHLGGLVDTPPGTCPRKAADFLVRSYPYFAPEITTYALTDIPVEPAMRRAARHDWIDLREPRLTVVHGPSGYRLLVDLVYAPAGGFTNFTRTIPRQHVGDRLIIVGGTHGYQLAQRGRTWIVNAGSFSGRLGRKYPVGGVVIRIRFGSRIEDLRTHFLDFNHDGV